MTGSVFAITSGKGGVGKTTTALNLGVALRGQGNSVAIVDADLGMPNLGTMLGVVSEITLHDVLAGTANLEDALVTDVEGFGVVTGDRDLQRYADTDPEALPDVVSSLRTQYEYVILDAGPGLGYEDILPLDTADEVILVTTPDPNAIDDVSKLQEVSDVVGTQVRGLLINKATESTDVEAIINQVGIKPLGVIPDDPTIAESTAAGVPIESYDEDSPGAVAYRELADVVTGDSTPTLEIMQKTATAEIESSTEGIEATSTTLSDSGGATNTATDAAASKSIADEASTAAGSSPDDVDRAKEGADTDDGKESSRPQNDDVAVEASGSTQRGSNSTDEDTPDSTDEVAQESQPEGDDNPDSALETSAEPEDDKARNDEERSGILGWFSRLF